MHDQIGVAANRRCEMGVEFLRQSVVADRVGRVARLFQRAQQGEIDGVLFGFVLHSGQKLLQFPPMRHVADLVAEALRVLAEIAELLQVRIFVDAVSTRDLELAHVTGNRFVGRQHEFLDELVGDVVVNLLDTDRFALLVEPDLDLGEIQIERAVREPLLAQLRCQPPHLFQLVRQFVASSCDCSRANASLYVSRCRERMTLSANSIFRAASLGVNSMNTIA